MYKYRFYSLIPAGVVSIIFFNGFSMITANKIEQKPPVAVVETPKFSSGNLEDNCQWIAIDTDSGACFVNPTSSFGPPNVLFMEANEQTAFISKNDVQDAEFCQDIATLESTTDGLSQLDNENGPFPVRWVCPIKLGA